MRPHGTVEHYQEFQISALYRAGALRESTASFPWCAFKWPGFAKVEANRWRVDIVLGCGAYTRISVTWSRCHLGGYRPWFSCPRCGRRVSAVYHKAGTLACRLCWNLRYASQRRGAKSRKYLQSLKLRLRLNGVASLAAPFPERPPRMHEKTYQRLLEKAELNRPGFLGGHLV